MGGGPGGGGMPPRAGSPGGARANLPRRPSTAGDLQRPPRRSAMRQVSWEEHSETLETVWAEGGELEAATAAVSSSGVAAAAGSATAAPPENGREETKPKGVKRREGVVGMLRCRSQSNDREDVRQGAASAVVVGGGSEGAELLSRSMLLFSVGWSGEKGEQEGGSSTPVPWIPKSGSSGGSGAEKAGKKKPFLAVRVFPRGNSGDQLTVPSDAAAGARAGGSGEGAGVSDKASSLWEKRRERRTASDEARASLPMSRSEPQSQQPQGLRSIYLGATSPFRTPPKSPKGGSTPARAPSPTIPRCVTSPTVTASLPAKSPSGAARLTGTRGAGFGKEKDLHVSGVQRQAGLRWGNSELSRGLRSPVVVGEGGPSPVCVVQQ